MVVMGEINLMPLHRIPWCVFGILGVLPLLGYIALCLARIELPFLSQKNILLQALELFSPSLDQTKVQ
jgi:hypothetical protein